jgi:hypothetical protein
MMRLVFEGKKWMKENGRTQRESKPKQDTNDDISAIP